MFVTWPLNRVPGLDPGSIVELDPDLRRGNASVGYEAHTEHIFLTPREDQASFEPNNLKAVIADLEKRMREAAANLEFEEAARLRDEIKALGE